MKQHMGVWLPDGEQHMLEWMTNKNQVVKGKGTYQYNKLTAAMKHVKQKRVCVDIGAHCGTWAMWLAREFQSLVAFEPMPEHRECFEANLADMTNWTLHPYALGNAPGRVGMRGNPVSTGSTHVWGEGTTEMRTLDSFNLTEVDFIKIDVEGLELQVCQGAEMTIRENRPVMVVEQKGREMKTYGGKKRDVAVQWLVFGLGMKELGCISGDWILGWK